ncbi:MAG: ATP-dependent DNA helicase RecG [Dehalococcoidia bacterium]
MTAHVTADYPLLRDVLARELAGGGRDDAIEGGLDGLLRRQARDEPPGSALLRMVAALPAAGYASLAGDARELWLRRALATVRRELTLEESLEPVPPGKRPARRKASSPTPGGDAQPSRPAAFRSGAASRIADGAAGLDAPVEKAGTGLRGAAIPKLEKLGIRTVRDALLHYPFRYVDFSHAVPISALRPGMDATVRGTVEKSRLMPMGRGGRMKSTEVILSDGMGRVQAVFFNQPFQTKNFPVGAEVALAGKVTTFRGRTGFNNPEWERLDRGDAGRMIPVYRSTEGLAQRTLRNAIEKLIERFLDRLDDPLPEEIRKRHHLPALVDAVREVHYPTSEATLREAQRRLAFDELLAVQIGAVARKREWQAAASAPPIPDHTASEAFLATLPFTLTGAQRKVLDEVRGDLTRTVPMSRLLEGDVGSGKTAVALASMLDLVAAGYQAVLMAPTEVLAEQHYRTVCRLLSGEPEPPITGLVRVPYLAERGETHGGQLRVVLLTGSTPAKERRAAAEAIRHGGAHLIVGTHALIQEGVDYYRLGLAVVDEQHRFGVMQRGDLRRKGQESAASRGGTLTPHLLAMSATPIPRSLALTMYGDLDLSVIDELPPGRTPIVTRYLTPIERTAAFRHAREEIAAGRQVFVICPLVEGSDTVESRAATEEYERLRTEEFPDLGARDRILLLHGRMASREKDRVMRAFAAHEADILVSTAVVEVGIDVPNATVMVIEGADRFGLAQLHQFRGRVGRGEHPSTCYLLADDPTPDAEERLSIMERTRDGFELAEADLQLRGPGDLFGTAQSGVPTMRVASLLDATLIDAARHEAEQLLDADPDLKSEEHRALRYAIADRVASIVGEAH